MLALGGKAFYVAGLPAICCVLLSFTHACFYLCCRRRAVWSLKNQVHAPDLVQVLKTWQVLRNRSTTLTDTFKVLFCECAHVWWELGLITETLFQDVMTLSHSQAPQKPIRRKYNPESQNPETVPPPSIQFPPPAKPAQKLVKSLTWAQFSTNKCGYYWVEFT